VLARKSNIENVANINVGWRGGNRTHILQIKSLLLDLLSFAPFDCWGDRQIRTEPFAFTMRCVAATPGSPLDISDRDGCYRTPAACHRTRCALLMQHTRAATRILRYASRAQLAKLPFAATQFNSFPRRRGFHRDFRWSKHGWGRCLHS
jgi:hypothetical protein